MGWIIFPAMQDMETIPLSPEKYTRWDKALNRYQSLGCSSLLNCHPDRCAWDDNFRQ
jgi:hypothetical protein